ncbi:pyruvate dehydrogenase complex dihydrolipoamide acetyltransferase [Temperatibacter marinus]|uniref:Acetyltransferase component of pyruvate dehydrogenase complex n=1 Tax=Temperatibacter marinus TaxID=1456591 RepID=A0AA52H8Z4_9PROT|nr:pyruvate dehydrogenase complex dihydrolipoamide acetyltransferase [Temperatibacter marinus]WND02334.1 pyruvate dehydrogenase complex dihydrolipoamide acetyltransferase [Temperatibacter marinus]
MAIEIFMPALSPTMEKGTLANWLVKEGDSVESGDVIAEIETDKATMEVESIDEGIIAKIFIAEGSEDVAVGELIAIMAEEGEDAADAIASAGSAKPQAGSSNEAPAEESPSPQAAPQVAQTAAAPLASQTVQGSEGGRVKASPLAKRIAGNEGIDISTVTGTGPNGRIVKRDIEAALSAPATVKAPQSVGTPSAAPVDATEYGPIDDNPHEEIKLSGMRKVIAKRLTESKSTVPHFYLTVECELDKLLAMRKEVNANAPEGVKVSVNDFIIKAVALALKAVPAANVQFGGDKMYWYDRADISVAVAVDGGLVTPVVKGACGKGLGSIASEVKDMATRARDGKLMPEEMSGGTFSISNLGMFGIKEFSAVINPPQGAILAVGSGEQRPVVKDGALAVATVMNCTLSCDHRAIDGAVGAEFLKAYKGFIENPLTMLL